MPDNTWSTRYYRTECPDVLLLMTAHGPDERPDPKPEVTLACVAEGHDPHPLRRITHTEWAELDKDDDDD
jgi:hypothetical protein